MGSGNDALDGQIAAALRAAGHDVTPWVYVDRNDLQVPDGCEVVVLGLGLPGCEPDPDALILALRRRGLRLVCMPGRREDTELGLLQKIVPLGVYDIVWDGPRMVDEVAARVQRPATLDDGLRVLQVPGEARGAAVPRLLSGWRNVVAARAPAPTPREPRRPPLRPAKNPSAPEVLDGGKPPSAVAPETPVATVQPVGVEEPAQRLAEPAVSAVGSEQGAASTPDRQAPVRPVPAEDVGPQPKAVLRLPRVSLPRVAWPTAREPAPAVPEASGCEWPTPAPTGLTLVVFGALPRVGTTSALVAWAGAWGREVVLMDANVERPGGVALAMGVDHPPVPWWEREEVVPGAGRLVGLPLVVRDAPAPGDLARLLVERVRRLHHAQPLAYVAVDCGSPPALAANGLAHPWVIMAAGGPAVAVVTRDDPAALLAARGLVNALRASGDPDVRVWLQGSTADVAEDVGQAMDVVATAC